MRFDILFPSLLFAVTLLAMYLSKRTESKLKMMVEEREFRNRDVALLVALIGVVVSVIVFVPQMAIMAIFLFSYSSLLFTVTFAFSDMPLKRMKLFCAGTLIASVVAGAAGFFSFFPDALRVYGALAFAVLALCALFALVYALHKGDGKHRWYVAALSPALFLLLFVFFNGSLIWFPFLLDAYGLIFAVLIVLYLSSLFTWKTVIVFGVFLTALDIILVWVTGTMVSTANAVSGLGLPVLVAFPTIPLITAQGGIVFLKLGLGDFFFAGVLGTQTLNKFGKKTAVLSVLTMCISFALFELLLLNPTDFGALPATLPIILGWLPVAAWKTVSLRNKNRNETGLIKNNS